MQLRLEELKRHRSKQRFEFRVTRYVVDENSHGMRAIKMIILSASVLLEAGKILIRIIYGCIRISLHFCAWKF